MKAIIARSCGRPSSANTEWIIGRYRPERVRPAEILSWSESLWKAAIRRSTESLTTTGTSEVTSGISASSAARALAISSGVGSGASRSAASSGETSPWEVPASSVAPASASYRWIPS